MTTFPELDLSLADIIERSNVQLIGEEIWEKYFDVSFSSLSFITTSIRTFRPLSDVNTRDRFFK